MSLIKVLAVFCFLHLAFGVEFSHARPLYTRLEVKAGSKLVIPCVFTAEHLSGVSSVGIEWGMTPEGGGPYRPIIYLNQVNLQNHQSKRFHLSLTRSDEEDCSLVISPTLQRDSGTYEVRLIVDNVQRHPFKKVVVHVTDFTLEAADTETVKYHGNLHRTRETPTVTDTGSFGVSPTTETSNYDSRILYEDRNPPSVTETEGFRMSPPTITKTSDFAHDWLTSGYDDSRSLDIDSATPSVIDNEGSRMLPSMTETSDYGYYNSGSPIIDRATPAVTDNEGSRMLPSMTETSDYGYYHSRSPIIDSVTPSVTDNEGSRMLPSMTETSDYGYYNSGSPIIDSVTPSVIDNEGSRMLPSLTETSDYNSGSLAKDSVTHSVSDTEGSRMLPPKAETRDPDLGSLDIHSATPSAIDTKGFRMSPSTTETSAYDSEIAVTDPNLKYVVSTFYKMKKDGRLLLMALLVGLVLLILIIIKTAECYYGIRHCKDRPKVMERLKRMEEGLAGIKEDLAAMKERCAAIEGPARIEDEDPLEEVVITSSSGSVITT